MKHLLFSIIFLFSTSMVSAQNSVQFLAKTNVKEVAVGEVFQISFQTNINEIKDFRPPAFQNFKIVGGPNQSSQTTITNGRVASNVTLSYSIMAEKKGTFTIPPAQINIKNKWYKSNKLSIKVADKKAAPNVDPSNVQDVFIQIEISNDTAFVGQQIIVDYKLYSNVQTKGASIINAPEYGDFYVENPRLFPRTAQRHTINGQIYESKIIERLSLFPQFPGKFDLEPVIANVRIALEGGSRSPFSFLQPTKTINARSQGATIIVRSIPADEPEGFTGGIGEYSLIPSVNRNKVKQNDAITLKIRMRGNGDPKKLRPPKIEFPDHVTSYEPKLIDDDLTESQGEIIGMRTYEYVLVPSEKGNLNLDLDLYYFNPDSSNFILADHAALNVEVTDGEAINDGEAILYDKTIESENSTASTFQKWGIPIVGLFSLLALGFIFKSKNKKSKIIIEEINWEERARQYLLTAQENIHKDGSDFYESIRNGIYGYVAQKLDLPISELTQEKAINRLRSEGISEDHIVEIEGIIKKSEIALFAGLNKDSDRQHMYDQAVILLGNLEKTFNQE